MFYISCNPGFEESLCQEIQECWPRLIGLDAQANQSPCPELLAEKGGVHLEAPLELGIQLNFFLKTAHRVLWRVGEFRVRDFPKLYDKIQHLPWERYLNSANVEWVVSASQSRLNHEKRIEETCREAFKKSFPPSSENTLERATAAAQQVFVRLHDDVCTVSLDSSGEHLHKRGWGSKKGEAPLRETVAAFILRKMIGEIPPAELKNITLVDPLCGSGTLLLEALSLWQPVFHRKFAFFSWKHTPKLFKTELWRKNYKLLNHKSPFKEYHGFDLDEKVLEAARANFQDLQSQTELENAPVEFQQENLFAGESAEIAGPVWCVTNPPYGERLRVQGQESFSYDDLLAQIVRKFSPEKVGLLLPDKALVKKMKPPQGFRKITEVPLSNGGLDVLFLVFKRS